MLLGQNFRYGVNSKTHWPFHLVVSLMTIEREISLNELRETMKFYAA